MPGILKWLSVFTLVPPIVVLGTLIPNGSVQSNGKPMANSTWWSCGAGALVILLTVMMIGAAILLVRRSKYARPFFLIAMASTAMSGLPLERLPEPAADTVFLWSTIGDAAPVALIAWYLYANKAVQEYFQPNYV
jgi:hypothetical protein